MSRNRILLTQEGTENKDRCHAAQVCDVCLFLLCVCLFGWFFALMLSASSKRELNIIIKEKCAHRGNLLLNSCIRLLDIFRSNY